MSDAIPAQSDASSIYSPIQKTNAVDQGSSSGWMVIALIILLIIADALKGPLFPDDWYCYIGAADLFLRKAGFHQEDSAALGQTVRGPGRLRTGEILQPRHDVDRHPRSTEALFATITSSEIHAEHFCQEAKSSDSTKSWTCECFASSAHGKNRHGKMWDHFSIYLTIKDQQSTPAGNWGASAPYQQAARSTTKWKAGAIQRYEAPNTACNSQQTEP